MAEMCKTAPEIHDFVDFLNRQINGLARGKRFGAVGDIAGIDVYI
jgi:hypothetical protein